jgi:hypothetical protein
MYYDHPRYHYPQNGTTLPLSPAGLPPLAAQVSGLLVLKNIARARANLARGMKKFLLTQGSASGAKDKGYVLLALVGQGQVPFYI